MTPVQATLLGVAVAALAAALGLLSYVLSRALLPLTPTAKLWDRMYEVDKLAISNPKVLRLFMEQVERKTLYFYAPPTEVPRNDDYYQLKTFVYFHLSVFEEMYQTTRRSSWVAKQFESEGWDQYIFEKLRHPLMKEVFDREALRLYSGAFREFIEVHRSEISKPPDPNLF
jgi:hypothetical protein